jgi:hypothetical protein
MIFVAPALTYSRHTGSSGKGRIPGVCNRWAQKMTLPNGSTPSLAVCAAGALRQSVLAEAVIYAVRTRCQESRKVPGRRWFIPVSEGAGNGATISENTYVNLISIVQNNKHSRRQAGLAQAPD